MANPLVFWENIYEDGTISADSEASGYPDDNVIDWRVGTPFRYRANDTVSPAWLKVDLGAGESANPTTVAIGGHNLNTAGAKYKIQYSSDDFSADINDAFSAVTPSDDLPVMTTWTAVGANRYWRLLIEETGSGFNEAPQVGVLTLGRRLDFPVGALADLDPYSWSAKTERSTAENGSPLGTNVLYKQRRYQINYTEPGFLVTDFFDPVSGLGWDEEFVAHAVDSGLPFWFAWDIDNESSEVYLCHMGDDQFSSPFVGTTLRRGLQCTFVGYREVS